MRAPRAAVMLRVGDHYRRHVFAEGLRRHGFVPEDRWNPQPAPQDLLLLWNRTRSFEPVAQLYESRGARVVIAENAFTQTDEGKRYCLFLNHHNGAGAWFVGARPRHPVAERPWRKRGDHVLVLPQRGIGERGVAMPSGWPHAVLERLRAVTDRQLVVRPHPGHRRGSQTASLDEQLADAHCAVTWGSGAGVKAIQAGIPVFFEFERWIGSAASRRLDRQIEDCDTPDREALWTRISWAQWTLEELGSGEAFDRLLNSARGDLFCPSEQPLGDHRSCDGRGGETVGDEFPAPLVAQLSRTPGA